MYCVHCGADGAEAFCRICGERQVPLAKAGSSDAVLADSIRLANIPLDAVTETQTKSSASRCWWETLDYKTLLESAEARKRIVAATARSRPGVTGEDILAVLQAVTPGSISLSKLTHAVIPLMDKLGIRTTNKSQVVWQAPPGRVLLAFLCVLASKSLTVDEVQQQVDACEVLAKLPLGVVTNSGRLVAKLEAKQGWVRLTLSVTIAGQWLDWGRSKKLVEEFLTEMNRDLIDQNSGMSIVCQTVA